MKKLLFCLVPIVFFACKKEEPDANVDTFTKIVSKYLICDSMKTAVNGRNNTLILGKGKGKDMVFSQYASFTIYSNPDDVWQYQMESPNKIYYWKTEYLPSQFYTILNNTTAKLQLQQNFTDSIIVSYFTVQK